MLQQSNISSSLHLPFEELLALLQQEGFSVKPDDYIELLKVVERFSGDDLTSLKYRLAPLIATNEEEQQKFYKVFDQYERLAREKDEALLAEAAAEKKERRYKSRLLIAAAALIALVLMAFIWYAQSNRAPMAKPAIDILVNGNPTQENYVVPGDTVTLIASKNNTTEEGVSLDTTGIQVSWNKGQAWEKPGRTISFIADSTGEYAYALQFQKGSEVLIDSQYIYVCESVIAAVVAEDSLKDYKPRDTIRLHANIRGSKNIFDHHEWLVNGTPLNQKGPDINYVFDSAGDYNIMLQAGEEGTLCVQTHISTTVVADPSKQFTLAVINPGVPVSPSFKLNPLLWLLMLLPLGWLLYTYYDQRRRARLAQLTAGKTKPSQPSGNKSLPPYEVPFENREMLLIDREPGMNTLFRAMRSKTEDEGQALDIKKSIRSEILSGGIPSLVFSNRVKHQEFVVLIDRSNMKNQQVKLFEYLARLFADENISVEKFYYRNFDSFHNENFPGGVSLPRLTELYKSSVLLIFGNAHQLIYPAYPVVEKEKAGWLHEWEHKAILTPLSYRDWSVKEEALKKEFVLLPADIEGQAILMQAIKEKQLRHDRYLSSFRKFVETSEFYLTDVDDLKEYLHDEILFQWLCATAVYPKIRWEIVIETGKAICAKYKEPGKVNFSSILTLVRIPWMQEGIFPESTRLALLKELSVENEIAAREVLLEMLKYPALYFPGEHFFAEEKALQEMTSQFVLYAHDDHRYPEHAQAYTAFKQRWQDERIPDGPLKAYLEKNKNGDWKTPLQIDGKNVPLEQHLNMPQTSSEDTGAKKARTHYIVASLIALLFAGIFLFGKSWLQQVSSNSLQLVMADTSKLYNLSLTLDTDSCVGSKPVFMQGLSASLLLYNQNYSVKFSDAGVGTVTVPSNVLQVPDALLQLTWNDGQSVASTSLQVNDKISLTLTLCKASALSPLYVRYNSQAGYNSYNIQRLLARLKSSYDVRDVRMDSFSVSKIIYYDEADRGKADSIVSIANTSAGMNLKAEYIYEKRDPPAVPILYLAFKDSSGGYREESIHKGQKITASAMENLLLRVADGSRVVKDFSDYVCGKLDIPVRYNRSSTTFRRMCADLRKVSRPALQDIAVVLTRDSNDCITTMTVSTKLAVQSNAADDPYDYNVPPNNDKNPASARESSLGYVDMDAKGYPTNEGQQLIGSISERMRANPKATIRLEGDYSSEYEQKLLGSYINPILSILSKEGINTKTRVKQKLNKISSPSNQIRQQQTVRSSRIHVIGIGFEEAATNAY